MEYNNPVMAFDSNGIAEHEFGDVFAINEVQSSTNPQSLLEDYYVCVLRTEDETILNEKRYLLPPTKMSDFMLMDSNDGFVKCNLSRYQSSDLDNEHFNKAQVVFTGTQNPFNYDELGNAIHSRAQELQYGNSINGVEELYIKVDVVHSNSDICLKPTIRLVKALRDKEYSELESVYDKSQKLVNEVVSGSIKVIISHKNLDNMAKYHMLNRKSNLYFLGSLP